MVAYRNRVVNPSFELGTTGVLTYGVTLGTTDFEPSVSAGTRSLLVTVGASPGLFTGFEQLVDVVAGEWIAWSAKIRYSNLSRWYKPRFVWPDGSSTIGALMLAENNNTGGSRFTLTAQVPAGATFARLRIYLYEPGTLAPVTGSNYHTDAWMAVGAPTEAEALVGAASYFDGDAARDGDWQHTWDGTPHASTSSRTLFEVHPWTQRWWESLPTQYQKADAAADYPMRRWMDGIGRMGGEMRQVSDDLYGGLYTNPALVPDRAVQWLAQMMGVPERQRSGLPADVRNYLIDLTSSGRKAVGTRASILEVAKRFLTGAKQVAVGPSVSADHTIVILVRLDEVPGGNLATVGAGIVASGVIPAGHVVVVKAAAPTWDGWEAGITTWDTKESQVPTWVQSDSRGVVLE